MNTVAKAIADGDTANSLETSTLQAKVGDGFSAVNTVKKAIADVDGTVKAQYTLQVVARGQSEKPVVAGFGMVADGEAGISEFTIAADKFFIFNPSDETLKPVFQIIGNQAVMHGSFIADDTIQGEKINASSQIQLADGGQLLIGTDGKIQIGDGSIFHRHLWGRSSYQGRR